MSNEPIDLGIVIAQHQPARRSGWCEACTAERWPCLPYRLAAAVDTLSDEGHMPKHVQAFATREDRHEIARWVRAALADEPTEPEEVQS